MIETFFKPLADAVRAAFSAEAEYAQACRKLDKVLPPKPSDEQQLKNLAAMMERNRLAMAEHDRKRLGESMELAYRQRQSAEREHVREWHAAYRRRERRARAYR